MLRIHCASSLTSSLRNHNHQTGPITSHVESQNSASMEAFRTSIFAFFLCFTIMAIDAVLVHPESVTVPMGSEANFKCVAENCRRGCRNIRWRVGAFNIDGEEYQNQNTLKRNDIVKTSYCSCNSSFSTSPPQETVIITILATSSQNGTAIQCRSGRSGSETYSKFALLQLEPAPDAISPAGSGDSIQALHSLHESDTPTEN